MSLHISVVSIEGDHLAEVADVMALLRNGSRIVTLTGPGGSGKTRLAIEAATELVGEFRAGVFWVRLASLRDSALVLQTITETLGTIGTVVGRPGHVDEIAGPILFLCTPFAGFISGEIFNVNGGAVLVG